MSDKNKCDIYSRLKNKKIDGEDALAILKSSFNANKGDDSTEFLILAIFAQLFDCSEDTLLEVLKSS